MKTQNATRRFGGKKLLVLGVAAVSLVFAGAAFGAKLPVAGDLLYDLYDIYRKAKDGGGAYIAGGLGIIGTAALAYKGLWMPAAGALIGTGGILKAEAIAEALGALVR